MKKQNLKINKQKINKVFYKVPSFAHEKLTPKLFGIKNIKQEISSKICIVGTGIPLHEDLPLFDYEVFDEGSANNSEMHDNHGCSTLLSGIISLNLANFKGLCPKSEMYYAKAFDDKGYGSYNNIAASVIWGTIKKVKTIILPCDIKEHHDGLYTAIKKAYDSNISIVSPISASNKLKYEEILYVSSSDNPNKNALNISNKKKVYTTYKDNGFVKAHGIYYKLSVATGLIENIKAHGLKSNKTSYEAMYSYFE